MKFSINGALFKKVINTILRLYNSSGVAKDNDSVFRQASFIVSDHKFYFESFFKGVYVRFVPKDITADGDGNQLYNADLSVLNKMNLKNSPIEFELSADGKKLQYTHGSTHGHIGGIKVNETFYVSDDLYDSKFITLPAKYVGDALKSTSLGIEKGIEFLPVNLSVIKSKSGDRSKFISVSLDHFKGAAFSADVTDFPPFSFVLQHGILNFICNNLIDNIDISTIKLKMTKQAVYVIVDNPDNTWEVVVPVLYVDEDIKSFMSNFFSFALSMKKASSFVFRFRFEKPALVDTLKTLMAFATDNHPFIGLKMQRDTAEFSINTAKGTSVVSMAVDKVEQKTRAKIEIYTKFIADTLKVYTGNTLDFIIFGSEADVDDINFANKALLYGVDQPVYYMFPVNVEK